MSPRTFILTVAIAYLALSAYSFADQAKNSPMVKFDFEVWRLEDWVRTAGNTNVTTKKTSVVTNRGDLPELGEWMLCMHHRYTGVFESPVFTVTSPQATFLLGGAGKQHAWVAIHRKDGSEIARQSVSVVHPALGDAYRLERRSFDLTEHIGERLFLRIVAEPVGYALGPQGGSLQQHAFVVFDAFRAEGEIDQQATQRRRALIESQRKTSLDRIADQIEDVVFAVRKVDRDPHWYANIGHWSGDFDRKLYHEGAKLCRLNIHTGKLSVLLEDERGGIRDPQVHYDGKKILFSYRPGGTEYYHLYEIDIDDRNMRRLTDGTYDDFEPTYLPDGRIMFVSTRCRRWVPCYFTEVGILYTCDADGGNLRAVSSNVEQENSPWPLPDGRIVYTRWEYVERNVMHFHHLWSTNPDGTRQTIYYGNSHPSYVMIDAKPIPGTQRVACIFCPGHGRTEHAGTLTTVTPTAGPDERSGTQRIGWNINERDPFPIGDAGFLLAEFGQIKLMNYDGQTRTVYSLPKEETDERYMVHEPRPIAARPRERIVPEQIETDCDTGRLFLADIYRGRNMDGVPRGSIKKLLVLEYLPKSLNVSNGSEPTSAYSNNLERILGTVPVESDGSAYFEVPALRTIFLAALDENDLSVKRMQSFLTVQPGETTGCVGCHEHRTLTPYANPQLTMAMSRAPSAIEPIEDVPDVFDYPRDIQPIWDRHCVSCHDWTATDRGGPRAGGVVLTGDNGPIYSHSYTQLIGRYAHLGTGPTGRFGNQGPYAVGSSASRLLDYLDGSHHDVKLSDHERRMVRLWIDSGLIFAGTNAAEGTGMIYFQIDRQTNQFKTGTYDWFKMPDDWPDRLTAARDVVKRRCDGCHYGSLPELDLTRDMRNVKLPPPKPVHVRTDVSHNLTRPELSLLLLGPLAESAGGYDRCSRRGGETVFADKSDPDYQTMLAYHQCLWQAQQANRRFNMPGFRPSEHYVREMKRYGILPPDFDRLKDPIDVYETDQAYWRSFWWRGEEVGGR